MSKKLYAVLSAAAILTLLVSSQLTPIEELTPVSNHSPSALSPANPMVVSTIVPSYVEETTAPARDALSYATAESTPEATTTFPAETEPTTISEATAASAPITTLTEATETTEPQSLPLQYQPLNYTKQRAMWFTYLDYEEILQDKTAEEFEAEIRRRFSEAAAIGVNTVYVHVRAHGDAYYTSEIFAPAAELNGELDPLAIMLKAAHDLGLSFHAWINPLRVDSAEAIEAMPDDYPIAQWYASEQYCGTYIVEVDGCYYLNPAYSEVRQLIADGVDELVSGYNVDGIHIDDYFYPSQSEAFDAAAFLESSASSLERWRKENVNELVSLMYRTIKLRNSDVLFGISPQGLLSNNERVAADILLWCAEPGWCDYITPQLYFGFENDSAPFAALCEEWSDYVCPEVALVIGICTYKTGCVDSYAGSGSNEWLSGIVASSEIKYVETLEAVDGAAIYSYASTFADSEALAPLLEGERNVIAACWGAID